MSEDKRVLVFAGPNGSGKSTVTKEMPIVGLYVNADEIKRVRKCSDLEAAQIAEATREFLLNRGEDFTFETVLSTSRNLDLLERARNKGYTIIAIFVLTCDSEINVQRVKQRVAEGGHDVSEEKVRSRYRKSLDNIPKLALLADNLTIMDNSGSSPIVIYKADKALKSFSIRETDYWTTEKISKLLVGN